MPPVNLPVSGGRTTLPGAATTQPALDSVESKPDTATKPAPGPTEQKAPNEKLCPHCGLHPDTPAVEVTPEDAGAFVRAVLADVPFSREYSLFGGALVVRYRTPTTLEAEAAHAEVARTDATAPETTVEALVRFQSAVTLHAAVALESVKIGNVVHRKPNDLTPAAALQWYRDRFRMDPVDAAARQAYLRFSGLTAAVQRKALDPSFFSATVGSGSTSDSPPPASQR